MRHFRSDAVAAALKDKFVEMLLEPPRSLTDGMDFGSTKPSRPANNHYPVDQELKLRDRFHFSMCDSIRLFATRGHAVDAVVHAGAGDCGELGDYCRMGARRVLLIEGCADKVDRARELEDLHGRITVRHAVVSSEAGKRTAYMVCNSRMDANMSLCVPRPTRLLEIRPAYRVAATQDVTTVSLAEACQGFEIDSPASLLVMTLNGDEARTLEAAGTAFLHRFKWIVLRVSDEPLFENGTTSGWISRIMVAAGFLPEPAPPNFTGPMFSVIYQREHPPQT
jgi:hypothetical protein